MKLVLTSSYVEMYSLVTCRIDILIVLLKGVSPESQDIRVSVFSSFLGKGIGRSVFCSMLELNKREGYVVLEGCHWRLSIMFGFIFKEIKLMFQK